MPSEKAEGYYKRLRLQAFIAATLGYSLYYVCRTSLNVMKQPIIDAGVLNATQLGMWVSVFTGHTQWASS